MSTTQNNTPGEAALLPAVLIEAAVGAADRALRTVFDTEARTALEQALSQGEADQGGRPPQWDADPLEPVTWMVRVRHEVRMAIQAALEAALSEPGETPEEDEPPPPRKPAHATLEAFVVDFLGPIIARKMPGAGRGFGWCPQWWRHAEAIGRLMALWEAWEFARIDGGPAMSTWWTVHCDGQLAVLMDAETGPFHLCRPDRHGGTPAPLHCDPVPDDWWTAPE